MLKVELFPTLFKLLSSCTNTLGNYEYISSTVHCKLCACNKCTSWPLNFYNKVFVLCLGVDLREKTAIISLYNNTWLVFVTETECVYCAVRTGSLYIILRSAHTAVFMCFVWISEQTAIISLYSINWLVCITETECLLRGTSFICKHYLRYSQ